MQIFLSHRRIWGSWFSLTTTLVLIVAGLCCIGVNLRASSLFSLLGLWLFHRLPANCCYFECSSDSIVALSILLVAPHFLAYNKIRRKNQKGNFIIFMIRNEAYNISTFFNRTITLRWQIRYLFISSNIRSAFRSAFFCPLSFLTLTMNCYNFEN